MFKIAPSINFIATDRGKDINSMPSWTMDFLAENIRSQGTNTPLPARTRGRLIVTNWSEDLCKPLTRSAKMGVPS